jgi:3-hydroxyacyl-[acyl-carrier-protein] dehydratase
VREGAAASLELTNPAGLEIEAIMELLPHRYPMLLVDRIARLEPGVSAEGVKGVTANEPYMAGHFPDYPIMPGVLIVDALAQVAGIMLRTGMRAKYVASGQSAPPPPSRPGVLASIPRMRFVRPVLPGDQLRLHTRHVKSLGNTHWVQVEARVNGQVVTAGELVLAS